MPQDSYTDLEEKLARAQRERDEALEQQTATSEVLRVISSSPGELEPVFQAMLANAMRLCEASYGSLSAKGTSSAVRLARPHRRPSSINGGPALCSVPTQTPALRAAKRGVVQVADLRATRPISSVIHCVVPGRRGRRHPHRGRCADAQGRRADRRAMAIYRQEVRPFTDKQIELVRISPRQAVIAIENTRLLNELREIRCSSRPPPRTCCKVISRSTFDLQSVLNTLVESAVRLCEADMGSINRQDGEFFRQVANYGHSTKLQAFMDTHPIPSGRGSIVGRTVLEGGTVHVDDVLAEPITGCRMQQGSAASARCLAFRCCAKACRSASLCCNARPYGRLLTSRSSWSRPSPTRR